VTGGWRKLHDEELLRLKRPGRENYHSPPYSAEVNAWSCTFFPPYVFMSSCFIKQGYFTFYCVEVKGQLCPWYPSGRPHKSPVPAVNRTHNNLRPDT
jgi:hypothetical protein